MNSLSYLCYELVTDSLGHQLVIAKDGTIMGVEEYKTCGTNKILLNAENRRKDSLMATEGNVTFYKAGDYLFDTYDTYATHQSAQGYAKHFPSIGQGNYRPAYACAESNSKIKLKAEPYEGITFKTERGVPLICKNGELEINLQGDRDTISIYASNAKDDILGKVTVISYSTTTRKLCLVPIGKSKVPAAETIKQQLDKIFEKLMVQFDVTISDPIEITYANGKQFTHGGSGVIGVYNTDQKTAITKLEETNIDDETCYLFMVEDAVTLNETDSYAVVSGYMPRGYQYGFIYKELTNARTIAHELSHGVFHLKHTFATDDYIAPEASTDNLMDYNGGTTLNHWQWKEVHNPKRVWLKWAQSEEGAEAKSSYNEQILSILKNIREANLLDNSSTELSVSSCMEYQIEVPMISFKLGNGEMTCLKIETVENEIGFIMGKTAVFTINPAEMTEKLSSDNEYTYFIYHKLTNGQKNEDIAFRIVVKTSEKQILKDYINPYKISAEQLSEIYPNASEERVKAVTEAINKYCNDFEINTPERMAHFLGQIGAETGQKLEDLSESSSYSARRVVEIFGYNKYGHLFEEAELNEATYEYTYKPIDYSCTSCTGNSIDKGTSTFALTRSEILNAYAEVKAEKEVEVDGKKVKKMLYNETPRTDVVLKDGKIEQYVSNTMYNEGKLRVKQQYINSNTLFNVTYACRMKNGTIASGDGSVYKGVGFIHLTGKGNYQSVVDTWNKMYPEDQLVLNHELIEKAKTDVDLAMKLAMAYWKKYDLNKFIKSSEYNENECTTLSRKVNGGDNGLEDRKKNTNNAYETLKNNF